MRAEFGDEEITEGGVSSFSEHLPEIGVREGSKGGYLELEEVVLVRTVWMRMKIEAWHLNTDFKSTACMRFGPSKA